MNDRPATEQQLQAFKKGAALQYSRRGVQPVDAVRLFTGHVEKLAQYMGVDHTRGAVKVKTSRPDQPSNTGVPSTRRKRKSTPTPTPNIAPIDQWMAPSKKTKGAVR